jgi:phage shock protein PspC (stress-responsive transcriptional regulator)
LEPGPGSEAGPFSAPGAATGPDDEPTARFDEPTRVDEPVTHEVPPAWVPPAPDAPAADEPLPPPGAGTPPPPPPPPGAAGPDAGQMPPGGPPPWFGAGEGPTFARDKLVRPEKGRYIAGVCAAIGRATNTDPVLWRVLLAVLGFFGGVGVLIYLVGWLAIPGEGDTASPFESLLGRGRSKMSPITVVALGAGAVLSFAFIVNDGFRATLLAVAVVVGAALLLKRGGGWTGPNNRSQSAAEPGAVPFPPAPGTPAPEAPASAFATAGAPAEAPAGGGAPTASAPAGEPLTAPLPPTPPGYVPPSGPTPPGPGFAPPTGGYRPPFAPHGPWASAGQPTYPSAPAQPRPPKAPKPPRERSKLGRITFFAVLFVLGMLALIDVAGVAVSISAYFAAALATIAFGLIAGAWIGRARGLIFLALLATLGLAVASGTERWGGQVGNNVYRPHSLAAVADRYDFSVGNATLDLRAVDFANASQDTTIAMKVGQVKVLLPDNVDTTADVALENGRAQVFGREWDSKDSGAQAVSNLGADGAGGGTLHLNIEMKAGNVEVTR